MDGVGKEIAPGGVLCCKNNHSLAGIPARKVSSMPKSPPPGRAFEEVAAAHLDALYRTALRYARGNEATAEDLLQDTLIKGLDSWSALREPQSAKPWLFSILSRLHLNRLRHAARHPETAAGDVDEHDLEQALAAWAPNESDPETLAIGEAGLQRVQAALDTLPAAWSEAFWLVEVEGFSYHEVADLLGVVDGTIASRLHRARAALREALTEENRQEGRR